MTSNSDCHDDIVGKPMTVREIVDFLQMYPEDTPVLVSGYEGGYESGIILRSQDVHERLSPHFGDYDEWTAYDKQSDPKEPYLQVILIERDQCKRTPKEDT